MSTELSTNLPWWVVVVGTAAAATAGFLVGGSAFPITVGLACLLAALLCDRSAMFTVIAQPPLVTGAVVTAAVLLGKPLLGAIAELSAAFPYLVATMGTVTLIVLFRLLRNRVTT